jgi:uncharacterized protein (TIGR02186 family)
LKATAARSVVCRCARTLAVIAAWAALSALPVRAEPLVADLSKHLVAITTGFVGTEVLLYGATEGEGDVVVVLRGPHSREVVRRKVRVGGVWVNGPSLDFENVPAFYSLASNRSPSELGIDPLIAQQHEIGLEHLKITPVVEGAAERAAPFHAALIRVKQRQGLYVTEWSRVAFLGKRLFSTRIRLPANVPTGAYSVAVFLVREGSVISAQTTPLVVSKAGLGAEIFEFAHRFPAPYGIIAILVAVAAGWLANVAFRRS